MKCVAAVRAQAAICYNAAMRLLALLLACLPLAAQWKALFNGKNLDGWEVVGDGVWYVMKGGLLVGDRKPNRQPGTGSHQSWLYTQAEYRQYDLSLEYWTRLGGNSGVSLRDPTRGRYSFGKEWDSNKTPSHFGYEIQIMNTEAPQKYPTGSVYLFASAKPGAQKSDDWNLLEIQSRDHLIRVKLNGVDVCEHPGDPARPKAGPIGLQLHDLNSIVMFQTIRIREVK